jgi:L-seryl-tRNA(Ser) seleniumtransferase
MRALRVDKMTYAALEITLQAYLAGDWRAVPVARMMAATADEIDARAQRLTAALHEGPLIATVIDGLSTIGGGSAPGSTLPTRLVQLRHAGMSAHALDAHLRSLDPPVIARIERDAVVLDLRTVLPADEECLSGQLRGIPTRDHRTKG